MVLPVAVVTPPLLILVCVELKLEPSCLRLARLAEDSVGAVGIWNLLDFLPPLFLVDFGRISIEAVLGR